MSTELVSGLRGAGVGVWRAAEVAAPDTSAANTAAAGTSAANTAPDAPAASSHADLGAAPGAATSSRSAAASQPSAARRRVPRILRRPGLLVATVLVVFAVATAFAPQLFSFGQSPTATDPTAVLATPSWQHLFGTDQLGRDLWARVVDGSGLTIQATVIALAIALVGGLGIGLVSGFAGGVLDAVLMRLVDVMLAIPGLLLALAIVTALGFGTLPVAVAVGVGIIPGFARATRAEVLKVKTLPFVEAARIGGARTPAIVLRHVLPNSWGPVAVLAVLDFGVAILTIAALSFLGFGAQPPAAEWGSLIADGRAYLVTAPWVSLLPGAFVALVVFSLNHISRTLEAGSR